MKHGRCSIFFGGIGILAVMVTESIDGVEVSQAQPAAAPPSAGASSPPTKLPFVLEHHLHARRTIRDDSVTLDDVVTGQSILVDGDRLQLEIQTSENGYLYLAFCSRHDTGPRYHGLSVFPAQGGQALMANVAQIMPSTVDEIVLDNQPGSEIIFVIVSKTELSRADSRLADILDGARQGVASAECRSFQQAVVAPPPKAVPSAGKPTFRGRMAPAVASPIAPGGPAEPPARRPEARIERGVDIVFNPGLVSANSGVPSAATSPAAQNQPAGNPRKNQPLRGIDADAGGIVVLRYEFRHVARTK